jgi:acetyl-CoA carboxylase biotin carboxyl carrier protein
VARPGPATGTIESVGLSRDDLLVLIEAFEASEWTELVLSMDGTRVELSRTGRPPEAAGQPPPTAAPDAAAAAPAPAAAAPSAPATQQRGVHEVRAPSVGIFYRAPEPGAPPFVEEGQHVGADDIVCIVEVMKLMNHVKAGAAGIVLAIHVENGAMIEHGQPLLTIETDR